MIWLALFVSMLAHELGHAVVADGFGDGTPRLHGRLTLHPWPHISVVWTILLPLATYALSGGFLVVGAMAPMPINYRVLTVRQRVLVALAGPGMNLWLAAFFATFWREAAIMNAILAGVNLLPIPPLDGAHLLEVRRAA